PADHEPPAAGPVQPAQQVHQGGLSGAGGADHRQVVAGRHPQRDSAQRRHGPRPDLIGAGEVFRLDRGGHGTCCPSVTWSAPCTTIWSPSASPATTSTRSSPVTPSVTSVRSARPSRTAHTTSAPSTRRIAV